MTEPATPLEQPITTNPLTWIERDAAGREVERKAQCECSKMFTQYKIAFRFVEALAKGRGEKAANDFVDMTGGGWVPTLCPPCESKELGRIADRKRFVESMQDRALPSGDR